jgi:hypothetical protein
MKAKTRNRHQKAAFRPGEMRVSRARVAELLELARSNAADERLTAATYLCPCHVRGRTEPIWQAVLGLMADADPRVRFAAWHTLEDGGVPREDGVLERLQTALGGETDPKVRGIAELAIGPLIAERERAELDRMRRLEFAVRGKCDFCGERDAPVRQDLDTRVPTAGLSRPALVCRTCATAA